MFNTMLKTKTRLQPIFLVGHRLATLVWHDEFHAKSSGPHPVVTNLRGNIYFKICLVLYLYTLQYLPCDKQHCQIISHWPCVFLLQANYVHLTNYRVTYNIQLKKHSKRY